MDELEIKVNTDLKGYINSLNCSKLVINATKTVYIIFKRKNKPAINIYIRINMDLIRQVEYHNYLGLVVGDKMNWSEHIYSVILKLSSISSAIKRSSYMILIEQQLYYSLVEPHISVLE